MSDITLEQARVMRKVRDGAPLDRGESPIWWHLVSINLIEYLFQEGAWLTAEGKRSLEAFDSEHKAETDEH